MGVIHGRGVFVSSDSSNAMLKFTISETEPTNPMSGDIWINSSENITVNKVIHYQSNTALLDATEPNTIYVIMPSAEYSGGYNPFYVSFFNNKKYLMKAYCVFLFITDAVGKAMDITRSIYDGTEWHTFTAFPIEPTEYSLISDYTASQTWVSPEDGWFKIELFGASGNGGKGYGRSDTYEDSYGDTDYRYVAASGGNGGDGGKATSIVKLKQGDTVALTVGAAGSTTSATVNSTSGEIYDVIQVTSGGNGGNAYGNGGGQYIMAYAGTGGTGGAASGGNVENINGSTGNNGIAKNDIYINDAYKSVTSTPNTNANEGCTTGGTGGYGNAYDNKGGNGAAGSAGFIKVYRGNTNVVSTFPEAPSGYELIDTYTESTTFTAPKDGYYQVEVFGASGAGSTAYTTSYDYTSDDGGSQTNYFARAGYGGGGSAYAMSNGLQLAKGDTVSIVYDNGTVTASINSSMGTYDAIVTTPGGNATPCNSRYSNGSGSVGTGGTASGGNAANINGGNGGTGGFYDNPGPYREINCAGGTGGTPGHTDGNYGGAGSTITNYSSKSAAGTGLPGFVRISGGNTN